MKPLEPSNPGILEPYFRVKPPCPPEAAPTKYENSAVVGAGLKPAITEPIRRLRAVRNLIWY